MLPTPGPSVLFHPVTEGAILLDVKQEIYFGLNPVAAEVWKLLPECADVAEICARISRNYPDIASDVIRVDVTELLDSLTAQGLVTSTSGA